MTLTAVGTVGTDPKYVRTAEGAHITTFRVVVQERRFDEKERTWKDGAASWLTVTTFGKLALNAKESIHRTDRILVTGRATLRDWQDEKGRSGSTLDVVADAVGPDLLWGTATYTRRPAGEPAAEPVPSAGAPAQGGDWGAPAPAEADPPF
ncbi:single-stranded DNA-binding protein [Naasia sp. SYSU D00948]|uniref:single-stranded DNA-binding protein n=1 Tax=Naasia sp. SYSU D00948 TaxID=2817379 RepID=UPI001B302996|nr:single-stranded DNA-binding protein [Naasia sp. SYSU D00948]